MSQTMQQTLSQTPSQTTPQNTQQAILAIECSSELCSVSLAFNTEITFKQELAPREHAYLTLPFAQSLLTESKLAFSDLTGIAFGHGPGAFTGLRVAASIAQGLSLAHDLPLYSACSLSALALQASLKRQENDSVLSEACHIVSVLDARMSELYWTVHQIKQGELLEVKPPTLSSAQDLLSCLKGLVDSPSYFIGPGCRHLIDHLDETQCSNLRNLEQLSECFPHSREVLSLVNTQIIKAQKTSELLSQPSKLFTQIPMPVYLRNNVAAKPKPKNKRAL